LLAYWQDSKTARQQARDSLSIVSWQTKAYQVQPTWQAFCIVKEAGQQRPDGGQQSRIRENKHHFWRK